MYNGYAGHRGHQHRRPRSSIEVAADGIVGRGVLLDIPRLRGVDWLEPGDAIAPEELDAARRAAA